MYAENYSALRELREAGDHQAEGLEVARGQARRRMGVRWLEWLGAHRHRRVVGALLPIFDEWEGRRHGRLTFRLTQILTGDGCFGEYLHSLGRESLSRCFHWDTKHPDSADHTLAACREWLDDRRTLEARVGLDLLLPTVLRRMARDEDCWKAVSSFAEYIMLEKEEAEREREQSGHPSRLAAPNRRKGRRGHGVGRGVRVVT